MLDTVVWTAIPALWLVWLTYWWASAVGVKRNRWREPLGAQLLHRIPLMLAALCLAAPRWMPKVLTRRFLPVHAGFPIAGTILLASGLGFTVWARRHLGRNWSASVVVKEDHALIRTGPYARVRHPIYSGLLLAFSGMAVAIGEWRGLVAVALAFLALTWKSQEEERRMRETFPEYEPYRRETAAIIPFLY